MLDKLIRDGICVVDPMHGGDVLRLAQWMTASRLFPAHVATKATKPHDTDITALKWPVFSPMMVDVLLAPYWFEHVLSFYPIVKEYLGGSPKLYSINAFFTTKYGERITDTQHWHRDHDDPNQLTVFMLGTDVAEDDGSHYYVRGTHRDPWGTRVDLEDIQTTYDDQITKIYGPAGTTFLEDTNGLHRADKPINNTRLLFWGRWGLLNPPESYYSDMIHPIPRGWLGERYPNDPELQDAIKLVVC